jgi:hypothetical protein
MEACMAKQKQTMFEVDGFDSSWITRIYYDREIKQLGVELKNGSVYLYTGVPHRVFKEFMNAESKGTYLNSKIKNKYEVMSHKG